MQSKTTKQQIEHNELYKVTLITVFILLNCITLVSITIIKSFKNAQRNGARIPFTLLINKYLLLFSPISKLCLIQIKTFLFC